MAPKANIFILIGPTIKVQFRTFFLQRKLSSYALLLRVTECRWRRPSVRLQQKHRHKNCMSRFPYGLRICLPTVRWLSDSCGQSSSRPTLPAVDLCCQTGCPNCVFAQFADELMSYCESSGRSPIVEINEITSDPNLRVMIQMLVQEKQSAKVNK